MENYILENGKKFFIHPVYKKYAANEDGEIMNIRLRNPRKGNLINTGYLRFSIFLEKNKNKTYSSHRFVFECFYGLIEKNKQINHINSIRTDNRIKNLEAELQAKTLKNQQKTEILVLIAKNQKVFWQ